MKGDVENEKQAKDNNTNLTTHENEGDTYYEKTERLFNSLMTEFFDAIDINNLIECMLAYVKSQTENPKFPESGFTLDKLMHLYINFHRLAETNPEILKRRGAVCRPPWLAGKKILGFRWFKWAEITLEAISVWQNISISIFNFSPFLLIKSYQFPKIY